MPHAASASKGAFEHFAGLELAELTGEEVLAMRPKLYRSWAHLTPNGERLYSKTHAAFQTTSAGEHLFPPEVTLASVYIVRNPLDVAVSWKFFWDHTFDESIASLADDGSSVWNPKFALRERIGGWSRHVESWRNAPFPVLVVRYEDLLADTARTLADIVRFLGMDWEDKDRIRRAVQFSRFEVMKKQEQEVPWERPSTSPHARTGRTGDWRNHLSHEQAKEVLMAHGPTMSSCGYRPQELLREVAGPARSSRQALALDVTSS